MKSIGDFQVVMRHKGRAFLGLGHTPSEAKRNAAAAMEQHITATGCQAMVTQHGVVESAYKQSAR